MIHVSTTVYLHYMDSNEMIREKVRWKLHKYAVYCSIKTWKLHPTKQWLYDHSPPILQDMLGTAGESKDEVISDVLLFGLL